MRDRTIYRLISRIFITHSSGILQLTVACSKMNRPEIAAKAVQVAEKCIACDKWPKCYDTKRATCDGRQSHPFQTWSIASFLVAKLLLADGTAAKILVN